MNGLFRLILLKSSLYIVLIFKWTDDYSSVSHKNNKPWTFYYIHYSPMATSLKKKKKKERNKQKKKKERNPKTMEAH